MDLENEANEDELSEQEREIDLSFFFSRPILMPNYWFEDDEPDTNEKRPEEDAPGPVK